MKPSKTDFSHLCRKYQNEDPHTLHVTRLALTLFDRTHKRLGVPKSLRPLLDASAQLHDLGYSQFASQHAMAGPRILLRKRVLPGVRARHLPLVAEAIRLHGPNYRKRYEWLKSRKPAGWRNALRLAAFLRVADGLDHSHTQDAEIRSIAWRKGAVQIRVKCGWYGGNIDYARRKGDLWHEVFDSALRFQATSLAKKPGPFFGVLSRNDSLPGAARKSLACSYRIQADARLALLETGESIELHDMRVAMRRFRTCLQLYRKHLPQPESERLRKSLAGISRTLGAFRDQDVWVENLKELEGGKGSAKKRAWTDFLKRQERLRASGTRALRKVLRGDRTKRAAGQMTRLTRVLLPEAMRDRTGFPSPNSFLGKKVLVSYRRLLAKTAPLEKEGSEALHGFRRQGRKARYVAELAAPVCGKCTAELSRRLRALTHSLGQLHDCDVGIAKLSSMREHLVPKGLARTLRKERKAAYLKYQKAWKKLNSRRFGNQLTKELKKGI